MLVSCTQLSFLSGRLLISGIAGAEAEPHMKNKLKSRHKKKRAKTSMNSFDTSEKPFCNECSFALRFFSCDSSRFSN